MQTEYVLRDIAPPRLRAPVQDSSDETLIGLIAEGDKRAMQVLYARHNVRVYRFILRMTANQSLAEDLVSEVFLDVWRQAENFESKSQVSTWLLAIARYKALSALRRRHDEHLDDEMAASIEDAPTTVGCRHQGPQQHRPEVPHPALIGSPRSHRSRVLPREVGG
jgi:RNA polymerase sigma factor (sigma-70 family)